MEVSLTTLQPFNCKGLDISSNPLTSCLVTQCHSACALTQHLFYLLADWTHFRVKWGQLGCKGIKNTGGRGGSFSISLLLWLQDGNTREEESSALYDPGIKERNEGVRLFPASFPPGVKKVHILLLLDTIHLQRSQHPLNLLDAIFFSPIVYISLPPPRSFPAPHCKIKHRMCPWWRAAVLLINPFPSLLADGTQFNPSVAPAPYGTRTSTTSLTALLSNWCLLLWMADG